jgi:hypothetical protein
MSEPLQNKVVNIVSPSYDWNTEKVIGSKLGYQSRVMREYAPTKGVTGTDTVITNGSNIGYQIIPDTTLVHSAPILSGLFTIEVNSTVTAGTFLTDNEAARTALYGFLNNNVGLQSLALNRCIINATTLINGVQQISSNPSDNVTPLIYQLSTEELKRLGEDSKPDILGEYNNSVMSSVLKSPFDSLDTRGFGSFPIVNIVHSANKYEVTCRVTERLISAPFQYFDQNPKTMIGVNALDVGLTFNNLDKFFAIQSTAATVTNGEATLATGITMKVDPKLRNLTLRMEVMSPHLGLSNIPDKSYLVCPHFENKFRSEGKQITGNQTADLTTVTQPFQLIPKAYAIWVSTSPDSATDANRPSAIVPEQFLPIEKCEISFAGSDNLLLNYNKEDLYHISKRNGYNGSMSMFYGGGANLGNNIGGAVAIAAVDYPLTGGVLYLLPSDFPTNQQQQSNTTLLHNFRCKVITKNIYSSAVYAKLNVVAVYDYVLGYDSKMGYSYSPAAVDPADVVKGSLVFANQNFDSNRILGGALRIPANWQNKMRDAWGIFRKVLSSPEAKSVSKVVRSLPYVNEFVGDQTMPGKIASSLGYGKGRKKMMGSGIVDMAGSSTGGANMNQQRLMDLLSK